MNNMSLNSIDVNTRKQISTFRTQLKTAIAANNTIALEDAARNLVKLNVPLKKKCFKISVGPLLELNCKGPADWDKVSKALGILDKYATNLLRPVSERPVGWDSINVKNEVYDKRVNPIVGTRQIINDIGYKIRGEDSIRLSGEPNRDQLLQLKVDLTIAKCELDMYKSKSHPFPIQIDQLVSQSARIEQDPSKQNIYISEPSVTQNSSSSRSAVTSVGQDRRAPAASSAVTTAAPAASVLRSQQAALNAALTPSDADNRHPCSATGSVYPQLPQQSYLNRPDFRPANPPSYDQCRPPYRDSANGQVTTRPPDTNKPGKASLTSRQNSVERSQPTRSTSCPSANNNGFLPVWAWQNDQAPKDSNVPPETNRRQSFPSPQQMNRTSPDAPPLQKKPGVPDSVKAQPSAPLLYSSLNQNSNRGACNFPESPAAQPLSPTTANRNKPEKEGWFGRMKQFIFGNTSSGRVIDEAEEMGDGSYWPGTMITVPREYAVDLLLIEDETERFRQLQMVIVFLEKEVAHYERQIEETLEHNENFGSDEQYRFLTRQKDDLKRELIILKRLRTDIMVNRNSSDKFGGSFASNMENRPAQMNRPAQGRLIDQAAGVPGKPRGDGVTQTDGSVRKAVPEGGAWECQHCTSLNAMEVNVCTVCSKTTDVKVAKKGVMWQCAHCTSHNPMSKSVCTVCAKTADEKNLVAEEATAVVTPQVSALADPLRATNDVAVREAEQSTARKEKEMMTIDLMLDWLKEADELGYTKEEFEYAMKFCKNSHVDPVSWLQNNWLILLEFVEENLNKDQADGTFTRKEVADAIVSSANEKEATQLCQQRRKEMIGSLSQCYNGMARVEIVRTIVENGGDERRICRYLNDLVLQPVMEEIQQLQGEVRADGGKVNDEHLRQIMTDTDVSQEARMVTLMVERQLSNDHSKQVIRVLEGGLLEEDTEEPTLPEVIEAVKQAKSSADVLEYLQRECLLCNMKKPESRIESMFACQCRVCDTCFVDYYKFQVRNYPVKGFCCPICRQPDIELEEDSDLTRYHFQMLDIVLKGKLSEADYDCFHKKLLNWQISNYPNFRWCVNDKCNNGFLVDIEVLLGRSRVVCVKCQQGMCYKCQKPWEAAHENATCEEYADWQERNHPDVLLMENILQENGIVCPQCQTRFELARGGCQHFSCTECRYQFCAGCSEPMNKECRRFPECFTKGMHAHHPRYCFSFLRDKSCEELRELLDNSGVQHRRIDEIQEGAILACRVMVQKEAVDHYFDEACDQPVHNGGHLCEIHYKEYLVNLLNKNRIDPVVLMDEGQCRGHLMEYHVAIPNFDENDPGVVQRLRQSVRDNLPLEYKI